MAVQKKCRGEHLYDAPHAEHRAGAGLRRPWGDGYQSRSGGGGLVPEAGGSAGAGSCSVQPINRRRRPDADVAVIFNIQLTPTCTYINISQNTSANSYIL